MANNTYYWDNGIRVHITRGKLQSSMARIAKQGMSLIGILLIRKQTM